MNETCVIAGPKAHVLLDAYKDIRQQIKTLGFFGEWGIYAYATSKIARIELPQHSGILGKPFNIGLVKTQVLMDALHEVRQHMPGGSLLPSGVYFLTDKLQFSLNVIYTASSMQTYTVTSRFLTEQLLDEHNQVTKE